MSKYSSDCWSQFIRNDAELLFKDWHCQASSSYSISPPRKVNKRGNVSRDSAWNLKIDWLQCAISGSFFPPLSLEQEVICSVQQAFCWEGFLRSVSHALALSRQAGSRVFALQFQCPWSSAVEILYFYFFLLFHFLDFKAGIYSKTAREKLHHSSFFFLSLPLSQMLCFHGLCVYIPLWRIACSSGFYSAGIGLWWQRQNRPQLTTNTVTLTRKEKNQWGGL